MCQLALDYRWLIGGKIYVEHIDAMRETEQERLAEIMAAEDDQLRERLYDIIDAD